MSSVEFDEVEEEEVMEELEEETGGKKPMGDHSADRSDISGNNAGGVKPKRRAPRGEARKKKPIRRTQTPGGSEDYLTRKPRSKEEMEKALLEKQAKMES